MEYRKNDIVTLKIEDCGIAAERLSDFLFSSAKIENTTNL